MSNGIPKIIILVIVSFNRYIKYVAIKGKF